MLRYLQLDFLHPMRYAFEFDKLGLDEKISVPAWKAREEKNILDFNFSNKNDKHYLKNLAKSLFSLKCLSDYENEKEFVDYFEGVMLANGIGLALVAERGDGEMHKCNGISLCLFGSYFNHSCDPNVQRLPLENRIVFYARKPVKKGEQLFMTYG
jgi:hypothetical protein